MRTLGRLVQFDERSRNFPIRAVVGDSPPRFTRIWACDTWLDQGVDGACVGFSFGHDIAAEPVVAEVTNEYARRIYRHAQLIDEWPGEEYEGTSVLAGAKAMKEFGWISEYRWAFNVDDVIDAVVNIGPVILGTNWYSGMWDADANGFIHPTGRVEGGHAILIIGYSLEKNAVLLHNSWGKSWGVNGRAWLSVEDLVRLLAEDGEVCIPMVRTLPEGPVVDPEEPKDHWFVAFWKWLLRLLWPF